MNVIKVEKKKIIFVFFKKFFIFIAGFYDNNYLNLLWLELIIRLNWCLIRISTGTVFCRIICLTIQTLCRSTRVFCTQLTNFLTKTIIMKTTFNKMTFALVTAFALCVSTASATWVHVSTYSGSWGSEVSWNLVDGTTWFICTING